MLEVVDREAALVGALEADLATPAMLFDTGAASTGYRLEVDAGPLRTLDQGIGDSDRANLPEGYEHVVTGVYGALYADAVTALVLAGPAAAIGVTLDGVITPVSPNVWQASNSVVIQGQLVQLRFLVAWVEVGWLGQMRLTTSDGLYTDAVWFSGFTSADQNIGWWDQFDGYGGLVGVLEWVSDGVDTTQFGIASTAGDTAGDTLIYLFDGDYAGVNWYDAGLNDSAWVFNSDDGGEVRIPDYNGGLPGCWDSSLRNSDCPS